MANHCLVVAHPLRLLLLLTVADAITSVLHRTTKREVGNGLRPKIHFAPEADWMNDPNGLVYLDGEYHLFFQRTPGSKRPGLKSWGHAVSQDLVQWDQLADALVPDEGGAIWSGSCVVDKHNTSGLQRAGRSPPMVAFYTNASVSHIRFEQYMAFSHDKGRTWHYWGKPVIHAFTEEEDPHGTARDPKVQWHEPTQQWIMVLFVMHGHVYLYKSADLIAWTFMQDIQSMRNAFECPDFFELAAEPTTKKRHSEGSSHWVLMMGDGAYQIGEFDGTKFAAKTPVRTAEFGIGYAGQTFNDEPSQRRVQISWIRPPDRYHPVFDAVPFMGMMSVPMELDLVSRGKGDLYLRRKPVKELAKFRKEPPLFSLQEDSYALAAGIHDGLRSRPSAGCAVEATVEARIANGGSISMEVVHEDSYGRGVTVELVAQDQKWGPRVRVVDGNTTTFMPLLTSVDHDLEDVVSDDALAVRVLVDWGTLEIFDLSGRGSMAIYSSELAIAKGGECSSRIVKLSAGSSYALSANKEIALPVLQKFDVYSVGTHNT